MKSNIKYIALALILAYTVVPTQALQQKQIATVQEQIEIDGMPKGISFVNNTELRLLNGEEIIPEGSTIYAHVVDTQGERRWHKSGFVICNLRGYEKNGRYHDVDNNIYMVGRKYEPIDKKEAAKTAAEITATTAAGIIVPGADIAYYFTKGMIKKKEDCTRFKSGISTAYENSIFWFWLKGKPLDLEDNASLSFKEITKDEAKELQEKIKLRKEKSERMEERKEAVKEFMSY